MKKESLLYTGKLTQHQSTVIKKQIFKKSLSELQCCIKQRPFGVNLEHQVTFFPVPREAAHVSGQGKKEGTWAKIRCLHLEPLFQVSDLRKEHFRVRTSFCPQTKSLFVPMHRGVLFSSKEGSDSCHDSTINALKIKLL